MRTKGEKLILIVNILLFLLAIVDLPKKIFVGAAILIFLFWIFSLIYLMKEKKSKSLVIVYVLEIIIVLYFVLKNSRLFR
ncbi:MAG: hypothetical protein Q4B70_16360 [Lachnospiraceae bacterium]|nr:hypothetical protein [Lachnospiraceae bacterium]